MTLILTCVTIFLQKMLAVILLAQSEISVQILDTESESFSSAVTVRLSTKFRWPLFSVIVAQQENRGFFKLKTLFCN